MTKEKDRFEELLVESFYVAIDAADPHKVVPPHIPSTFQGDVVVVGAGKAAASMAAAVEQAWPEKDLTGVVITRHGHSEETHKIQVLEASHPIPDKSNLEATQKMMDKLDHLKEGSLLLALISGGGSSLLSLPVEGVTIEDIRKVTEDLLKSGTSIDHINAVRKHVSQVKGGQLALAARAKGAEVLSLIISDTVGDNPSDIASGPCAEDFSTYADALWYLSQRLLKSVIRECAASKIRSLRTLSKVCKSQQLSLRRKACVRLLSATVLPVKQKRLLSRLPAKFVSNSPSRAANRWCFYPAESAR